MSGALCPPTSAHAQLDESGGWFYASGMTTDAELSRLAIRVGAFLLESERRVVTAESCTGGWIGKQLTDIPGSSAWYLGGVVAYSNTLKQSLLGVLPSTLSAHGGVSEATAREMAIG